MKNIGITLKKTIKKSLENTDYKDCISIWLFGSVLKKVIPRDIDILYIYRYSNNNSSKVAIGFRKIVAANISKVFDLEAHIVLLTEEEEKETNFIYKEKCRNIWVRQEIQ